MKNERQRRARVSITLPPELWAEVQETAAEIEGVTPSRIIETIVRQYLTEYKMERNPDIVSQLEWSQHRLAAAKRQRANLIKDGEYCGELEEDIKELQFEIMLELNRLEVEGLMAEQSKTQDS